MGGQNIGYPHNEILFGHKKEWSTDAYYNMDELWTHMLSERSQTQEAVYYRFYLYEMSRLGKFTEK